MNFSNHFSPKIKRYHNPIKKAKNKGKAKKHKGDCLFILKYLKYRILTFKF